MVYKIAVIIAVILLFPFIEWASKLLSKKIKLGE